MDIEDRVYRVKLLLSLFLFFFSCSLSPAAAKTFTFTQVTNDTNLEGYPSFIDPEAAFFTGYRDTNYEVLLYKHSLGSVTRLTQNSYHDLGLEADGLGNAVWYESNSSNTILFYDNVTGSSRPLTQSPRKGANPKINNGYVLWKGTDADSTSYGDLFTYDSHTDKSVKITTDDRFKTEYQINAKGDAVWYAPPAVVYYNSGTGEITPISDSTNGPSYYQSSYAFPQINAKGDIVWRGMDSTKSQFEIFLYDGTTGTTKNISNNDIFHDRAPMINDRGDVVWVSETGFYGGQNNAELFFYDSETQSVKQITQGYFSYYASINNNGDLAWSAVTSNQRGIFYYEKSTGLTSHVTPPQGIEFRAGNFYPILNDQGVLALQGRNISTSAQDIFIAFPDEAPPKMVISDSSVVLSDKHLFFPDTYVGNNEEKIVTIKNDGGGVLEIYQIPTPSNPLFAPYSISSDSCSGAILAAGGECRFKVYFQPPYPAIFAGSFDISSNDSTDSSLTLNVTGKGIDVPQPRIVVKDSVSPIGDLLVPYGSHTLGSVIVETVTIANNGDADLLIDELFSSSAIGEPFVVKEDHCSSQSLPPFSTCTVKIAFAPTMQGSYQGLFTVLSNDPAEWSLTVNLSGTATAAAVPHIGVLDSVSPVDDLNVPFGVLSIWHKGVQTLKIVNRGNADLTIGTIAVADPLEKPFSIFDDGCSEKILMPTAHCTVFLNFTPPEELATDSNGYEDSFDIPSSSPDQPSLRVTVSGSVAHKAMPDIVVLDSSLPDNDHTISFGEVTTAKSERIRQVTILNVGNADLHLGNIAVENSHSPSFALISVGKCSGKTLAPDESCSFSVLFAPKEEGLFRDSFKISSDDPDENPTFVTINGKGLSGAGANGKNPPKAPELLFPAPGQGAVERELSFSWKEAEDPDNDPLTYKLYLCEESDFQGCEPTVVKKVSEKIAFHWDDSWKFLLIGFVGLGALRKRERAVVTLILLLSISNPFLLTGCGGGGESVDAVVGEAEEESLPPAGGEGSKEVRILPLQEQEEVSSPKKTLNEKTTYYWKVAAVDADGNITETEARSFTTN